MSAKAKKRKWRFKGRLIIFLTLLITMCLVLFLTNFLGFASLRRLSYRIFAGVNGNGTEETIKFNENQSNVYAFTGDTLSVVSPDILSGYDLSGSTLFSSPALLRTPAISSTEAAFLAYDLGGLNYYIADENKILLSKTTDSRILNANLNILGSFTIITDSPDCKTLVTAFNSDHETIFKFHSSQKYVFDAAISPSEKTIAIATYGTTDGSFESGFSLCRTNEDSFFSTTSLGTSIPLKVSFISPDRISVICNDKALIFNDSGKLISEISYNNATLKNFSVSYGHISILLSSSGNTTDTQLIIIDSEGSNKTAVFSDDILSISSAGDYTAVLSETKCVVYNKDLSKHCEIKTSPKISKCLVKSDGSILLLSDNSAIFYVK